jgi:predicted RNase H-like HicB family nuclease
MVTKEDIERYYAEKLGNDYENDEYAVPSFVKNYLANTAVLESDENGLYYAVYEVFPDHERVYVTIESIRQDIKTAIDATIADLENIRGL